jgi:DASS family divalent anion:Na+ symporter
LHKRLRGRWGGLALLVLVYLFIVYLIPRPAAVKPEGWRLSGIFIATITGLVLQPIPGGALVLAAIALVSLIGGLTIQQALAGYGDPTVWLVMAAFFISRALINTGLARRIALFFVRLFGQSSLGVSYALTLSDMVLASVIPSNGARSGGVILPIARSIAELYGSHPGPTAALLGSFLLTAVYQGICVTTAMFLTGQASNALAAQIATQQFGVPVTWSSWFVAGLVPGLCSIVAVPWVVQKLNPPTIRRTPEAAAFARSELAAMGPMSLPEKMLACVFVIVCGLWATSAIHKTDVTIIALCGAVALLLAGVLKWEDVLNERAAWDMFVWYGGMVRLGKALNDTGVTTEFARGVGSMFGGAGWITLFAIALLIYFYAHYAFASITAHILAMLPPFVLVLLATGAPKGLVVYAFICFSNFSAGLTHYGTTPSPLFFAQGYTSMASWWKIGFVSSLVNIAIWSVVGFTWWKLVKIW